MAKLFRTFIPVDNLPSLLVRVNKDNNYVDLVTTETFSAVLTPVNLVANGTSQATATANLKLGLKLASSGTSQALASANLKAGITLASAGFGVATGTAALTVTSNTGIALVANGTSQATATASLSVGLKLASSGVSQATATAGLKTSVSLTVDCICISDSTAQLRLGVALRSIGLASATATATLTKVLIINGTTKFNAVSSSKERMLTNADTTTKFTKLSIDPMLPINADVVALRKHIYNLDKQYKTVTNQLVEFIAKENGQ